jgi:hypothetical protein
MRFLTFLLALLAAGTASAQSTLLQGGSYSAGHIPMYTVQGSTNPQVQDSGAANGGGTVGAGLSELLMVSRGQGTAPYSGQGTGPYGGTFCMYDAPVTNATGYHYLCLNPNSQGGGMIAYGAGGAASALPLNFIVNGTTIPFTGGGGGGITALTGDVTASGTGSVAASVVRLQGRAMASTAPTNGQVLTWSSGPSQWQPATPSTAADLPTGGTIGQALVKNSGTNYDASWQSIAGVGTVTSVGTGTGLSGGPITGSGTISLANTAVSPGTYGSSTQTAQVTVDAQGRLTSVANVPIVAGLGSVTSVGTGTGLTGGPITTSGTVSLANTAVTPATYGSSSTVGQFTVDQQGRLTAASSVAISASAIGAVTSVATGTGLSGGPITSTGTINLANTAVTPGVYGDSGNVSQVTIDAQGRVTLAANVPIAGGAGGTVTSISGSGGTTGLTLTGGPITGAGTLTLGGTLIVANGGTGLATLTAHAIQIGNGTGAVTQLATGTVGQVLTSGGAGADPTWAAAGTGTVTSVGISGGTTGLSVSGSPVTTSGTITLSGTLVVGNGGTGRATITANNLIIGAGTSAVTLLAPGTAGTVLTSNGAGVDPSWATVTGTGTVTSVQMSGGTTGLSYSGGPITGAGTITTAGTLARANGGTGLSTVPTNGQLLIGNGSAYTLATITGGTGISVTNGSGTITIANTGGSGTVNSGLANQIAYYGSNGTAVSALSIPIIYASQYGVVCDGVTTNQHVTIQNAINAASVLTRPIVQLPSGVCLVGGSMQMNTAGMTVRGAGRGATIIKTNVSNDNVFYISDPSVLVGPRDMRLEGITFQSSVVRTAGAAIKKFCSDRAVINDVEVFNMYIGILLVGTNGTGGNCDYNSWVTNSYVNSNAVGIYVGEAGSTNLVNFPQNVFLQNIDASVNSIGLYAVNAGGLFIQNVGGITNTVGAQYAPGANQLVSVISYSEGWDTSGDVGIWIEPTSATATVTGRWIGCAGTATEAGSSHQNGLYINGTTGKAQQLIFDTCQFSFNSRAGVFIDTATDVAFVNTIAQYNSVATSNTYSGMNIINATDVTVMGGRFGASTTFTTYPSQQKYGIDTSGVAGLIIQGTNSKNNLTAGAGCTVTGLNIAGGSGLVCGNNL